MANGCWLRWRLGSYTIGRSYTYTKAAKKKIIKYTYTTYTNTHNKGENAACGNGLAKKTEVKWFWFWGKTFFLNMAYYESIIIKTKYFIKIWPSFCVGSCVRCEKCMCNELDILATRSVPSMCRYPDKHYIHIRASVDFFESYIASRQFR